MTLSPVGALALAIVILQLSLSLIFQFGARASRFATLDLTAILPRWRFFTNESVLRDIFVDIRGRLATGETSSWRKGWMPRGRGGFDWLWQPRKTLDGVVWLAVVTLDGRQDTGKEADADTSASYRNILSYCRREIALPDEWSEIQFALVSVGVDAIEERRFVSKFHSR